jgi:hypothetical protein
VAQVSGHRSYGVFFLFLSTHIPQQDTIAANTAALAAKDQEIAQLRATQVGKEK